MLETSRFAPAEFPPLAQVAGVTGAVTSCHMKSGEQPDLLLVAVPAGTAVAGVFTQSSVTSGAVDRCRTSVRGGRARALVVHAGNANALTGRQGNADEIVLADPRGSGLGGLERRRLRRRSPVPISA